MFHNDFTPYYVRVGDSWSKIDYSKHPETWMKPLVRGTETDLIEMPASWYLDDLPPMMFIKKAPNSHGFVNPRDLEELWRDQFDWVYRECDYAVFPITIHPDVAGRPQVLLMLERLYRAHERASRRALHDARGDRRGFRAPLAAQELTARRMCGLCGMFDDGPPLARCGGYTRSGAGASRAPAACRDRPRRCWHPPASPSTTGKARASCCAVRPAEAEIVDNLFDLWRKAEALGHRVSIRSRSRFPCHVAPRFDGMTQPTYPRKR